MISFSIGGASTPRRASHPLLPQGSARKVGASIFLTTPHVGQLYHVTLSDDPFGEFFFSSLGFYGCKALASYIHKVLFGH